MSLASFPNCTVHSYIKPSSKVYSGRAATIYLRFHGCRQGADKLFGLAFQNRIEILDIPDLERGLQRFLLRLVSIAFYHDDSFAQDGSDDLRNGWRLDERVRLRGEDVVDSIGVCDQHLLGVKNAMVSDESFVRYLVAPFCKLVDVRFDEETLVCWSLRGRWQVSERTGERLDEGLVNDQEDNRKNADQVYARHDFVSRL